MNIVKTKLKQNFTNKHMHYYFRKQNKLPYIVLFIEIGPTSHSHHTYIVLLQPLIFIHNTVPILATHEIFCSAPMKTIACGFKSFTYCI